MTTLPDEVFEAGLRALHGAPADKPSLELLLGMDAPIAGLRAALEIAYAAGQQNRPDRYQWGVRRPGFRSVRATSEDRARWSVRSSAGALELMRRPFGEWEVA